MRRLLIALTMSTVLAGPALADAAGDLKQGREALRRADYATAQSKASSAIDAGTLQGERAAEAYRTRAAAQFQLRDLNAAFADVGQALSLNPQDAAALGLRCQIYVAGGDVPKAQADLKAALALNARAGQALICQAGIDMSQRKYADAVAAYDRAIAAGEDTPDLRASRATTLAMAGKPQEAIAALGQVIAANGSAVPARRAAWLTDRARLHAATGESELAIRDLDEAMRLDPNNAREHGERLFLRARQYSDQGQFDRALADLNSAITFEQNAPDGRKALLFAMRGSAYAGKGDFARAIADYDGALGLAKDVPPRVQASWYAVRGRANLAAGNTDAAFQDIEAALRLAPDDVEYLGERGSLHLKQGRVDAALADFQAAVQKAPNNPFARSWLAWGYVDKGDTAKSVEIASQIVQMRPQEPFGYHDRGIFRFLLGQFGEAAADLDKAVELAPRNMTAVLLAHVARARAGDTRTDLLAQRAQALDLNRWPGPLVRLFLGQATPEQVLQAAAQAGGGGALTEANFYAGEYYLVHDQPQYAADMFRRAVDVNARDTVEHSAAVAELKRVGG